MQLSFIVSRFKMVNRFAVYLCLWSLNSIEAQMALPLEDETKMETHVAVGQAETSITINGGVAEIKGTLEAAGTYAENWNRKVAVIDCLFSQPVALPADTHRIALKCRAPRLQNQETKLDLRVVMEDRRGKRWAFGTRFGGENSRLLLSEAFVPIESRSFLISETGRLDPWVATQLDAKGDAYDLPQPPLRLAGFRLVVEAVNGTSFDVAVGSVRAMQAQSIPDKYWSLVEATDWTVRSGGEGKHFGNFGWAPDQAEPFLSTGNLGIAVGTYVVDWEILDCSGWKPIASGFGERIATSGGHLVDFPLLPAGTYQLRLSLRKPEEKTFKSYFFRYVVIRNEKPGKEALAQAAAWIRFDSAHGPVYAAGLPADLTLAVEGSVPPGARLGWRVESADQRILQEGSTGADKPVQLDISKWRGKEAALWITAELFDGEREIAAGFRKTGFADRRAMPDTQAPVKNGGESDGQFLRIKGDSSEGLIPIATEAAKYRSLFEPWIAEAHLSGYNAVELPATWYDLNPLPGVYQFGYLDRLVGIAREQGLRVILRVHARSELTPSWLQQLYQEDQEGLAHGLWNGSNFLVMSPSSEPYKVALFRYMEALARHYSGDNTVLGYCMEGLFFDHDMLDMPWLGQYADYSEAAREGFADFLRMRRNMAQVDDSPPKPDAKTDAEGRLMPRRDRQWLDWMDYKLKVVEDFRLGGVAALRRGDPGCWVGTYTSETVPLFLRQLAAAPAWLVYGSMESLFPKATPGIHGRYEPHAKTAKTAALVDVGLSNLMMSAPPGYNAFFNYYGLNQRLATLDPLTREAEDRLHQWFLAADRLAGARFAAKEKIHGQYLFCSSLATAMLQHQFTGRLDDYYKPFLFRVGADKVRVDPLRDDTSELARLAPPYLYVPYAAAVLSSKNLGDVDQYVKEGGRLIMEAPSGYWCAETGKGNALGNLFHLPGATPVPGGQGATFEEAQWTGKSAFSGIGLRFRTGQFDPPIDGQPVSFIHDISKSFLRSFRFSGVLPEGAKVLACFADGKPAVVSLHSKKGEVLYFCGTIDWLGCPNLAAALDDWGCGRTISSTPAADPQLLSRTLVRGNNIFIVGRRFIDAELINNLKSEIVSPALKYAVPLLVRLSDIPESQTRYRFRDLLNGVDLGIHSLADAEISGLSLNLTPGQAFLIEAAPEK